MKQGEEGAEKEMIPSSNQHIKASLLLHIPIIKVEKFKRIDR